MVCVEKVMRVSVIVPALNEETVIASTLEALRALNPEEVIVVDGGSADLTREMVRRSQAKLTTSARGRAAQMNQGATLARGDVLLFLHADTRLPASAIEDIRSVLADARWVGGRFDVKLNGKGWVFKVIAALINLRSRLTRVATGDQAIFVRRRVFEQIGGFPNLPLIEDIAFSRALKKTGRVACLRSQVATSARRWEKEGVCKTILKMWALRMSYLAGISPDYLKRFYGDAR